MRIRVFWIWVRDSFQRLSASEVLSLIFQCAIVIATISYVVTSCNQLKAMNKTLKETKKMAGSASTQATAALGQLTEMKNSSTDTHDLAQAAKDQASNTEKLADAAIKQVQELKASVKAAITQSEVAQEANRISSSGIERGQRPWVAIGAIRIFNKPTEGEPLRINAKVVNGGKTPGVHAFVYHAFKLLITTEEYLSTHIPLRNEPEIEKCTQPKPKWTTALGGAIVLPGATNVSFSDESAKLPKGMIDLIAQKELPFNAVDFEEIRREGISPASTAAVTDLFLVGCIDYFDESNIAHRTYFCYMYNPFGTEFEPTGDFNNCTNGNSAD